MDKTRPPVETTWFFGLLREAGGYRIVTSGPSEARVRRALEVHTTPTMVVTLDDLPSLNVGEVEWRRWLPDVADAKVRPRTS